MARQLDVVTVGRSSVDLYGEQVGGRLEDMASFAKYVGGCPTNIAVGTARLGLRSALITRVGDEHMGRFIKEQCAREGVDVSGIVTDPQRLTALVILGIRDKDTFPLIFYRENCADAALSEADIDEELIARAKAVVVTGTHFSTATLDAASRKAMRLAKAHGGKVVLDIDYRPVLWGLTGHGLGEERFVASDEVTVHLQRILPECDLVVGTEEEIHIAGGSTDTMAAIRAVRAAAPDALIVVKRGPMGCTAFPAAIPAGIDEGVSGPGFPVEVFNVLGAGDAFMSGFLRGWLKGESHQTSATWANACGAFAVSRLLCAPEYPSWAELDYFLTHGSRFKALRKDEELNHIHWATTRRRHWPRLTAFAIDHRKQIEDIAGERTELIPAFKVLAVKAAADVAAGRPGFGMLLDDKWGRDALFAVPKDFWIGRPIELPGSRPLRFEFSQDIGSRLVEWPVDHCIKVLCFWHPDDGDALKAEQLDRLRAAQDAARRIGRDILVEIIASKAGPIDAGTSARALAELYAAGLRPDWWKLEPQADAVAWANVDAVIEANDPYCRGVVLLGLEAPEEELARGFAAAHHSRTVRGFAVGRTIFAEAAKAWFAGTMSDEQAVADMAGRFRALVGIWGET